MNKTKIENFDYSVNYMVGCTHGCKYCYARKIAARFHRNFYPTKEEAQAFKPHLRKHILAQGAIPPGKHDRPQRIFVCSMGDLFCDGVPDEWIAYTLKIIRQNERDQFFFLTKNPQRYLDLFPRIADVKTWDEIPVGFISDRWYFGTSVDFLNENVATERLRVLRELRKRSVKTWASFEPMLGHVSPYHEMSDFDLHWAVIGAQTNPVKQPTHGDILRLKWYLNGAPTWIKDNVKISGLVNVKEPPR